MADRLGVIAPDVHEIRGEIKMTAGWFFPLRTVIVRGVDGGLWVHSPQKLDESLASQVEALGVVETLVAPNNLHHLFIGDWKARWPGARMIGARGLLKKRADLRFDSTLDQRPEMPVVEAIYIDGAPTLGETVFFHAASKSLICTDLMFNLGPHNTRGFLTAWILRMGSAYGRPAQSRLIRVATKDRARAGAAIEQILRWPFERIVMAHGDVIERDAKSIFEQACHWMLAGVERAQAPA